VYRPGMWSHQALYSGPLTDVDFDLVRQFVLDAEAANLFTESLTFEAKERKSGNNIAEAVAALSNTDGGIVLVGVKDQVAPGENRIAGVSQRDHDQLVASLHNLLPAAMPQVWPVRIPGTDKIVIVLRVDADAVAHPVLVAGGCSTASRATRYPPTGYGSWNSSSETTPQPRGVPQQASACPHRPGTRCRYHCGPTRPITTRRSP
jgi:hypothetical protein